MATQKEYMVAAKPAAIAATKLYTLLGVKTI